jgi:hypothetical protein
MPDFRVSLQLAVSAAFSSVTGRQPSHTRQLNEARSDCKGRWWSGENQSRWYLTKVEAQYEVLGNEAKSTSVPVGTIENARLLVSPRHPRLPELVGRPVPPSSS